jgi:predicted SAM-dependent methyltransferase
MKSVQQLRLYEMLRFAAARLDFEIARHVMRREPPLMECDPARLLNLGCGERPIQGWVNADLPRLSFQDQPNWMLDATRPWRCPSDTFGGVFTEHTLEHVTYEGADHILRECYRTMKVGAWIRIVTPDIRKYVALYAGHRDGTFSQFSSPAHAISSTTQNHGHRSVWDAPLFIDRLSKIGFRNAREVAFGDGTDPRLIQDSRDRRWESLYVEAQK